MSITAPPLACVVLHADSHRDPEDALERAEAWSLCVAREAADPSWALLAVECEALLAVRRSWHLSRFFARLASGWVP